MIAINLDHEALPLGEVAADLRDMHADSLDHNELPKRFRIVTTPATFLRRARVAESESFLLVPIGELEIAIDLAEMMRRDGFGGDNAETRALDKLIADLKSAAVHVRPEVA